MLAFSGRGQGYFDVWSEVKSHGDEDMFAFGWFVSMNQ